MPFFDYHASAAVLAQRLPAEKIIPILQPRHLNLSQRLCLQVGNWLIGIGQWLSNRASRSNRYKHDFELA